MLLRSFRETPLVRGEGEDSEGVCIRTIFGEDEGAKSLSLRMFELRPSGKMPHHAYAWEQEVFILHGSGIVKGHEGENEIKAGDAVLIPAGEPHQFLAGDEGMRLLCAVPILGATRQGVDGGRMDVT